MGFVLESPTWRANPDWAAKIGYSREALANVNHAAIDLMREVRDAYETERTPIVISGCIGPRGDGYDPGKVMSAEEAGLSCLASWRAARRGRRLVSAFTMNNVNEALGVTRAAQAAQIPCVISFTVETDGRLPTGDSLADAIEAVDAATGMAPAYYMINCAHPAHFARRLTLAHLGSSAYADYGPTRRGAAMQNSTTRPSWTPATRQNWANNTPNCCAASLTSTCSAVAAGQIIGTWNVSAWPARLRPEPIGVLQPEEMGLRRLFSFTHRQGQKTTPRTMR